VSAAVVEPALVSTIIPVYNRPALIREAVESVLAQTYRPIEVLVCDDASTDDTPSVVEALARAHPGEVRLLRLRHGGAGASREAGRQMARGEFLQYLDSDDLLRPLKFELQVKALRDRPDCAIAYGSVALLREGSGPSAAPYKWTGHALPTLFPWLLVDRWWATSSPLYRRSLCDAIGPWTDLGWSEDWEYDARAGALGARLAHCPEFVSEHRDHSGTRLTAHADWGTPSRLQQRKRFLGLMLGHARAAGVTPDTPEMQHFSRWVFHVARQFAAVGMADESRECLQWAKEAAGPVASRAADYRGWDFLIRAVGPRAAGRMALAWSRYRATPGPASLKESWMPGAAPRLPG
jgi:hypothetical protein